MTYTSVTVTWADRMVIEIAGHYRASSQELADWTRIALEAGRAPGGVAKEANPAPSPGEQTEAITLPGERSTRRLSGVYRSEAGE